MEASTEENPLFIWPLIIIIIIINIIIIIIIITYAAY